MQKSALFDPFSFGGLFQVHLHPVTDGGIAVGRTFLTGEDGRSCCAGSDAEGTQRGPSLERPSDLLADLDEVAGHARGLKRTARRQGFGGG
ncbi:hypothetical protein [Roseisalinus antarcticus]|uniref:hypothetical protein n=1 Tax=Roseisalinus antarcticus TaxID=254357 RepID=UPI00117B9924|nr:hypothetical protein [Roseisalinus antarcticus]